ncbi:MAG: hypothetical protein ACPF8V_01015, partial [Luteibaculum sp.]
HLAGALDATDDDRVQKDKDFIDQLLASEAVNAASLKASFDLEAQYSRPEPNPVGDETEITEDFEDEDDTQAEAQGDSVEAFSFSSWLASQQNNAKPTQEFTS